MSPLLSIGCSSAIGGVDLVPKTIRDYDFRLSNGGSVYSNISDYDETPVYSSTTKINTASLPVLTPKMIQKAGSATGSLTVSGFNPYYMFTGLKEMWFSSWVKTNSLFPDDGVNYHIARLGNTTTSRFDVMLKKSSGQYKITVFGDSSPSGTFSFTKNVTINEGGWNYILFELYINGASSSINVVVNGIAGVEVGDSVVSPAATYFKCNTSTGSCVLLQNVSGKHLWDGIASLSFGIVDASTNQEALTTDDKINLYRGSPLGSTKDVTCFHANNFYNESANSINSGDEFIGCRLDGTLYNTYSLASGTGWSATFGDDVLESETIGVTDGMLFIGAKRLVIDSDGAGDRSYFNQRTLMRGNQLNLLAMRVHDISGTDAAVSVNFAQAIGVSQFSTSVADNFAPTNNIKTDRNYWEVTATSSSAHHIEVWIPFDAFSKNGSIIQTGGSPVVFAELTEANGLDFSSYIDKNIVIIDSGVVGVSESSANSISLAADFAILVTTFGYPYEYDRISPAPYSVVASIGDDSADECVLIERNATTLSMIVKSGNYSMCGIDLSRPSPMHATNISASELYNVLFRFSRNSGIVDAWVNGQKQESLYSLSGVPDPIIGKYLNIGSSDPLNIPNVKDGIAAIAVYSGNLSNSICAEISSLGA